MVLLGNPSAARESRIWNTLERYRRNAERAGYKTTIVEKASKISPWGGGPRTTSQQIPRSVYMGLNNG